MTIYLTSSQITAKYGYKIEEDLIINNQPLIEEDNIKDLIEAAHTYLKENKNVKRLLLKYKTYNKMKDQHVFEDYMLSAERCDQAFKTINQLDAKGYKLVKSNFIKSK